VSLEAQSFDAPLYELRRHPDATRYTLLAAYCWQRRPEIIDTLVELLMQLIHRIETRAEKQIVKTLVEEVRRVQGKPRLLYELAQASLEHPEQTIQEGIYPVVSKEQLQAIVKEYQASTTYHQQVSLRMQASYRHYFHRVVPELLAALEIRSNNQVHQPVLKALTLVKRYAHASEKYYPLHEDIPLEGVVRPGWRDFVEEKTADGLVRINRLSYELCVLQALRERLRCRELWVVGANKYRNYVEYEKQATRRPSLLMEALEGELIEFQTSQERLLSCAISLCSEVMGSIRLPTVLNSLGVSPAGVGTSASVSHSFSKASSPSSTAACSPSERGISCFIRSKLALASSRCA
jgi:hypothetical protein